MGDNFNIMNDSAFNNYYIFRRYFNFVRKNNHFDCEPVDAKTNCYNWIYGKCSDLDIPNIRLAECFIELHKDCQDVNSFLNKVEGIIDTDDFKNLFIDSSSCNDITFKRKFSLVKYVPKKDYAICLSDMKLLEYMCDILTQTDNDIAPRIPVLVGNQGSGKTYITNELLPYYLKMLILGNLYTLTIDCSKVKDGSDIYFKHNPLNVREVLVGAIAEGIMRSNEEGHENDFFLVILDNYTEMPISAMDAALGFLGDFYSPARIRDYTFERKKNFGIVMNGRRYGEKVFQDIVNSERLCSRCNIIYESPYANKIYGKNKYLESDFYYGILTNIDKVDNYLRSFGDDYRFAVDELKRLVETDDTGTIDCRKFAETVHSSRVLYNKTIALINTVNDLVKSLPDNVADKYPDSIKNVEDCILALNMYLDYDEVIYMDSIIDKKPYDILLIYVVIILQQLKHIKETNTWITQYESRYYLADTMCKNEIDWERTYSEGTFMFDKYYCTGALPVIANELYYNIAVVLDKAFDIIIRECGQDNFGDFIKKCQDMYNDIFADIWSYKWGNPDNIQDIDKHFYSKSYLPNIDNSVLFEATNLLFNSIV